MSSSEEFGCHDFFMALAFLASSRSKDGDTQVGACIVIYREPPLVAGQEEQPPLVAGQEEQPPLLAGQEKWLPFLAGLGYNGMPDGPGFKDYETEYLKPPKHKLECHAEVNAIVSAFRRHADLSKSNLYITHSPCSGCCKLITQSGIKKVLWAKEYDENVEEHMKPIRESAENREKSARFFAVEQYLKPLEEFGMTVKKYHGNSKIEIDLGPSLWVEGEKGITDHCKIQRRKREDDDQYGTDQNREGTDQNREGTDQNREITDQNREVTDQTRERKDQNGEGTDQNRVGTKVKESGLRGEGKRKVDITKDDFFMAIAKLATTLSTSKPKVGACLVTLDPPRAVSIGYSECYEPSCYKTEKEESYQMQRCAESMAITSAFRVHADLTSSVLYVTSPLCSYCARIVVQSGVKTVIYSPSYSEEQDKNEKKAVNDEDEKKPVEAENKKKAVEDKNQKKAVEDEKATKDKIEKIAVKEIFDRARILYLEYRRQKKRRHIIIDLIKNEVKMED